MDAKILYIVMAQIDNATLASEWMAWLNREHLQEVIAGGAGGAEVFSSDATASEPLAIEVHYRFESRARFEAYLRDSAPALRAKGLAAFPPERGIALTRRVLTLQK